MYFIVDLLRESQGFRQRPITKIAVKAKISNEDYSLIKRHLSGISLESCQTVIDYFQKGAFQQFYSENRSVISEKIRDNLTFNTFLQLEQITGRGRRLRCTLADLSLFLCAITALLIRQS